jgi:hypothetical protein
VLGREDRSERTRQDLQGHDQAALLGVDVVRARTPPDVKDFLDACPDVSLDLRLTDGSPT